MAFLEIDDGYEIANEAEFDLEELEEGYESSSNCSKVKETRKKGSSRKENLWSKLQGKNNASPSEGNFLKTFQQSHQTCPLRRI